MPSRARVGSIERSQSGNAVAAATLSARSTHLSLPDKNEHGHHARHRNNHSQQFRILQKHKHKIYKIHQKLPELEAYEKELEFQAEAPGRVLIRLEHFMGTDRLRITDQKYNEKLFHKLQQEEHQKSRKRAELRRRGVENMARKLVIEGEVEADADMFYLHDHPVFRANQILNRLSKLDRDYNVFQETNLRPIKEIEPFAEYDQTGILFGFHKNHYKRNPFKKFQMTVQPPSPPPGSDEFKPPQLDSNGDLVKKETEEDEPEEEEWGGEDYHLPSLSPNFSFGDLSIKNSLGGKMSLNTMLRDGSLDEAKAHYGINVAEDLESIWTRHQSPLIEMLFSDEQVRGCWFHFNQNIFRQALVPVHCVPDKKK